jgi:hypothetical protein
MQRIIDRLSSTSAEPPTTTTTPSSSGRIGLTETATPQTTQKMGYTGSGTPTFQQYDNEMPINEFRNYIALKISESETRESNIKAGFTKQASEIDVNQKYTVGGSRFPIPGSTIRSILTKKAEEYSEEDYRNQWQTESNRTLGFDPETKVSSTVKGFQYDYPYAGAEFYSEYQDILAAHPEAVVTRALSSPFLNVDLALSDKRGREKKMVEWLHGIKGSPTGKGSVDRMWLGTIAQNPFVNISLMAGGSAFIGGASKFGHAYLGTRGMLGASKVLTAGELIVGGYFVAKSGENVVTTFKEQGKEAGIGSLLTTGLYFGSAYGGYKLSETIKIRGRTASEWGGFKGETKYINNLVKAGTEKYGGKTTYEMQYRYTMKPKDWINWYQREPVGNKLVGLSKSQGENALAFSKMKFEAQKILGGTESFIGKRDLVGQRDFGSAIEKAQTLQGKTKFKSFLEKQRVIEPGEDFGGGTYKGMKAKAITNELPSHDYDRMIRNLSRGTRRMDYALEKFGIKKEDIGVDVKPWVRPGKQITRSGFAKQKAYSKTGEYGDYAEMRWSETMGRLADASTFPTEKRVALVNGVREAKDINSFANVLARLHYQKGSPKEFDLGKALDTTRAWEKDFVTMGTSESKALFDTKTLYERWSGFKNEVYYKVLPKRMQNYFQERNFKDIMGLEKIVKGRQPGISDIPPIPNIASPSFIPSVNPFGVSSGFRSGRSRVRSTYNSPSPSYPSGYPSSIYPSVSPIMPSPSIKKSGYKSTITSPFKPYPTSISPYPYSPSPSPSPYKSSASPSPSSISPSKSRSPSNSVSSFLWASPSSVYGYGGGGGWDDLFGKKKRFRESRTINPFDEFRKIKSIPF